MANLGCDVHQYVPGQFYGDGEPNLRGECSGNGFCNETSGQCICDPGWSSRADFFGETFTDCQASEIGLIILHAILLLGLLGSAYMSYPGLKKRYHEYNKARQSALAKGKVFRIYQNRGAFTMLIWYGIAVPCMVVYCVARMALPEERVGVTVLLTTLFMVVKNTFYLCGLLYQPYLFTTLLKGERMSNTASGARFLYFVNVSSFIGFLISTVGSFIPYISVANPDLAASTFAAYYLSQVLGLAYNGTIAVAIFVKAEKLFSASYSVNKDEKVLKTKVKMKGFQKKVAVLSAIFAAIYLMMLLWPFWWNLHDYFAAITWFNFLTVSNGIALATNESKEKTTQNTSTAGKISDRIQDTEPEEQSMSV